MKSTLLLIVTLCSTTFSSCAIANNLIRIPVGILQVAGRTTGISSLSDEAPAPITDTQEKQMAE